MFDPVLHLKAFHLREQQLFRAADRARMARDVAQEHKRPVAAVALALAWVRDRARAVARIQSARRGYTAKYAMPSVQRSLRDGMAPLQQEEAPELVGSSAGSFGGGDTPRPR